jgi:hypothetical protein
MRNSLAYVLIMLFGLTCCAPKQASHDRAYLETHLQTLRQTLKRCRNTPGARGPECVNAYAAEETLAPGPLRNLTKDRSTLDR